MNLPTRAVPETLTDRISPRLAPTELAALEPWRVVQHLGSGATAHVWLLEDQTAGALVACKTPRTPQDQTGLSQEAKLSYGLRHEHIVQPRHELAPGMAEQGIATCWEFLAAGSLQTLITAGGPISTAETVTVLLPMLDVVRYLHDQQIIHGDISPNNILFDVSGRPVLIDLGSVRATAHAFHQHGTPGFMAPEIAAPAGEVQGLGAAADVYSLAAIGWFCLTGSPPGAPYARVPLVTLLPKLNPVIAELLEACLDETVAQRPSLDRLLAAVASWAAPEPVDLFASAHETLELQLPTRQPPTPQDHGTKRRRRSSSLRRGGNPEVTAGRMGRIGRWAMLLLGFSALSAGVAATMLVTPGPGAPSTPPPALEQLAPGALDVQSIVDTLARSRGAAWAAADTAMVVEYAVTDSAVYADDVQLLSVLHSGQMRLEGIRMRAVTESMTPVPNGLKIIVAWQTDGYRQVNATGEVIQRVAASVERLVLEVVQTPDGWRLDTVRAL